MIFKKGDGRTVHNSHHPLVLGKSCNSLVIEISDFHGGLRHSNLGALVTICEKVKKEDKMSGRFFRS